MRKTISLWEFVGFAFVSLFGTLLHFLYDWTGGSLWVAPFSGVNESTWEHMKLLFFPMLVFAFLQAPFFRGDKEFFCIKLRGILLGLALIPILFYTYNGAIGKSPDWINIAIFFVSAAMSYFYENRLFAGKIAPPLFGDKRKDCDPRIAVFALCLIAALFVLFTFATPQIGIFEDPLSGAFGI